MPIKENQLRKVTIDYSDIPHIGIEELQCFIHLNLHEVDGSRTIVLRTLPRESVINFIGEELVGKLPDKIKLENPIKPPLVYAHKPEIK